jgi:aryl-alcohol dehydrogenase-like predicted oxidoreductase
MRLALGTVQFGLDYGIANARGRTPHDEVARILERAASAGMDTLDTAAAYGLAEQVLGEIGVKGWRVVSKVPPVPLDCEDGQSWVMRHVEGSLKTLGIDRLDGLLLHRSADLTGPQGTAIAQGLRVVRAQGCSRQVGVSVYSPQALHALPEDVPLDLVQGPLSVLDQRMVSEDVVAQRMGQGTAFHARSVFLQGLLLMNAQTRPPHFMPWAALWARWDALVRQHGGHAAAMCLGYVKAQPLASRVVVGVNTLAQLEEILAAWAQAPTFDASDLACDDPLLLEPYNWSKA